jgi:hypothetical protein
LLTQIAQRYHLLSLSIKVVLVMSSQLKFNSNLNQGPNSSVKVRVTDLISRLNEEKKIEKKRNLALGVAAVSAVTVFGIILTI